MFMIEATAQPGHSLAELEAAIVEQIGRIQAEPPAAEELTRGAQPPGNAYHPLDGIQ